MRQTYREACEAFERELIAGALAEHGGNVPEAASALGLGRSTLYKKMVALGL
ncbi:Bacterial regulatory protein, Fis family [compost metagenome]